MAPITEADAVDEIAQTLQQDLDGEVTQTCNKITVDTNDGVSPHVLHGQVSALAGVYGFDVMMGQPSENHINITLREAGR